MGTAFPIAPSLVAVARDFDVDVFMPSQAEFEP
jgi:hypothetical protein